jgi:hypothetical protein
MNGDVLERGIWCTHCDFFESGSNLEDGRCTGCGCPESIHVHAAVREEDDRYADPKIEPMAETLLQIDPSFFQVVGDTRRRRTKEERLEAAREIVYRQLNPQENWVRSLRYRQEETK